MKQRFVIGVFGLLIADMAAGCARSASPYDKLCRIYEEVEGQPTTPELAMKVMAKAEKELPSLSEDLLTFANASVDQRYELLREMAKQKAGQPDWKCEAIKKWYPPRQAN
jgi:hypothetical protein